MKCSVQRESNLNSRYKVVFFCIVQNIGVKNEYATFRARSARGYSVKCLLRCEVALRSRTGHGLLQ